MVKGLSISLLLATLHSSASPAADLAVSHSLVLPFSSSAISSLPQFRIPESTEDPVSWFYMVQDHEQLPTYGSPPTPPHTQVPAPKSVPENHVSDVWPHRIQTPRCSPKKVLGDQIRLENNAYYIYHI